MQKMAFFLKRFLVGLGHVQKLVDFDNFSVIFFCYSWFRLQLMAIHCYRRGCRQIHLTRHFSPAQCAHWVMCYTRLAQECVCARHVILMVIHVVRLSVRSLTLCSSPCSFPCVSPIPCSSPSTSTCTLSWTSSSMWTTPRQTYAASPPTEESCPLAEFTPPTGYEPKLLDDFHYSETTEMIFQEESGDKETEPSYLCDAELDDKTIGEALSSPLFIQERGESADRRQAYHSHEESLLQAQSFFAHSRTGRPVHELGVWHFGGQQSSHRLWAQRHWRLPDLRDHWNFHPGVLQRHHSLELAWLGDQWRHHRQSALFTTVHSGARRSSEP